jgi:hypothetical protein
MSARPGHRRPRTATLLLACLTAAFAITLAAAVTSGPWWFILSPSDRYRIWFAQWNAQFIVSDGTAPFGVLGKPPRFGHVHFRPALRGPTWWFDYEHSSGPLGSVTQLVIPLWAPLLLTGAPAAWMWRCRLILARRRRRGGCPGCGYDLRATSPGLPCPECGRAASAR